MTARDAVRRSWRAYNKRAASYQAEVLLTLIYIGVLGPTAGLVRIAGKRSFFPDAPGWRRRPAGARTLEEHRRQF